MYNLADLCAKCLLVEDVGAFPSGAAMTTPLRTQQPNKALLFLSFLSLVAIIGGKRYYDWHEQAKEARAKAQEEAREKSQQAADEKVTEWARSLVEKDSNPAHVVNLVFQSNPYISAGKSAQSPYILKKPYMTEAQVEVVLGKPSSIDQFGGRIWVTQMLYAHPDQYTHQVPQTKTPDRLVRVLFDSDGRLSFLEMFKDYDTGVGRTFEDFRTCANDACAEAKGH